MKTVLLAGGIPVGTPQTVCYIKRTLSNSLLLYLIVQTKCKFIRQCLPRIVLKKIV